MKAKVAWEVFCGCAKLTKALCGVGFNAKGFDYSGNKDKPVAKVVMVDLASSWGQREFWRLVDTESPDFVWFAPPCGSASKAREIRRKDGPDPKPLRSSWHPNGLPNLKWQDKERVRVANALYKFTAEAVSRLSAMGIAWVVENPTNSYMWETSWFKSLLASETPYEWSDSQACMHGGKRNKKTSLLFGGNVSMRSLSIMCDGKCKHLPWV